MSKFSVAFLLIMERLPNLACTSINGFLLTLLIKARARPVTQGQNQNAPPGPFPPGPYPPNNFYGGPPPPGSWGRGGPGPMPPNFGNMPYPPPPGWFPPGQGFPPGVPGGPAPWGNQPFPPGPGGFPGPGPGPDAAQNNNQRPSPTGPSRDVKQAAGPGPGSKPATPSAQPAPKAEPKTLAQVARQASSAPSPPVESKPSVEEVKAVASNLTSNGSAQAIPTGPKNSRPMPVVPLTGPTKPFYTPPADARIGSASVKTTVTAAPSSVQDATNAARAAVAVAMAQLGNNAGGNAMDNLTNKVNEMRFNAVRGGPTGGRGRGRGGRPPAAKVEVPDSDFDFAESNAKFSKQDLVKEAIAGPVSETAEAAAADEETSPAIDPVYNKSTSFFDNISSEAKDRSNSGQKPGGREWRGEEQRKNMETFGQGSVDGGYRNFRGRGRGRGGRGRGFSRGGRGGGNRPQYPNTAEQ